MNIKEIGLKTAGVRFSGHEKQLDKKGAVEHNFYYLYDPEKYNCEVELYNIYDDGYGNFDILEEAGNPAWHRGLDENGRLKAALPEEIDKGNPGFAYRFKLTDKNNPDAEPSYAFDNGSVINIQDAGNSNNKFNVVLFNRAVINKNGPMQLIMPDSYYPGAVRGKNGSVEINEAARAKALASVRTHANKLGGNFYGIIKRLPELKKEGIVRIVGTPFTKDEISSHLYWTENPYQTASSLGNENDFKELQRQLFSSGINWVADAALVNEGLGGIHINSLLRKGSDSYASDMFKTTGNTITLGVLPSKNSNAGDETIKNTKMKFINVPFIIENGKIIDYRRYNKEQLRENPYDPKKPSYIQLYDARLADDKQINSNSPSAMKTYAKKNTDNIYDITRHDDAVYPFAFEADPEVLKEKTAAILKQGGKIDNLKAISYDYIKRIADFENYKLADKNEAGGIELWDGNVDIAKLKFYDGKNSSDRGSLAVRDYMLNSGKYWTKLTAETQKEYITAELAKFKAETPEEYLEAVKKLLTPENGRPAVLPEKAKEIDKEIIKNVIDGNYELQKTDGIEKVHQDTFVKQKIMDIPFETLPVSENLLGILTSPYMTYRPENEDELGLSKYELMLNRIQSPDKKYGKTLKEMNKLYEKITNIITAASAAVHGYSDYPNKSDYNNAGLITEAGRYALAKAVPDLTKYILIKALNPDAEIGVKDGYFDFSKVNPENITMQSLGIKYNSGMSDEQEAMQVINKLQDGLNSIEHDSGLIEMLRDEFGKRFGSRTLNDYRIAEMIHDRTESGLGWRIDAAKDIAAIDDVRSNDKNMQEAFDNIVDFWKKYNQAVLKENPHAYTTAEFTDLADLFKRNDDAKYKYAADAEKKFLEQTGITSVANYNYFFSMLPAMFSRYSAEDGGEKDGWTAREEINGSKDAGLRKKLIEGWTWYDSKSGKGDGNPGFLFESPEDGVINSYTFVGNHDKPRVLHGLALNMNLFHHNFLTKQEIIDYETKIQNTKKELENTENDEQKRKDLKKQLKKYESAIEHEKTALKFFEGRIKESDLHKLSGKALAMGVRIEQAVNAADMDAEAKNTLKNALINLVLGSHKGKTFPAEAFGTRPIETALKTVFDEAEFQSGNAVPNRRKIENSIFVNIMEPALDKYKSIYKALVTLPGSPADFAGDRLGLTGYESKTKNYHQQNRNVIPWEYLEKDNEEKYKLIKDFYHDINEIANLRHRPELSALNNGASVFIPVTAKDKQGNSFVSNKLQAVMRYNGEGSVVLSLYNNTGASADNTQKPDRAKDNGEIYESIILNPDDAGVKAGLKHGLKEGMKFKNAANNDEYVIKKIQSEGRDYYSLEPAAKINSAGAVKSPIRISPEELNNMLLYCIDAKSA